MSVDSSDGVHSKKYELQKSIDTDASLSTKFALSSNAFSSTDQKEKTFFPPPHISLLFVLRGLE